MIAYKKDADNIVTLTLDMEGRSENIINQKIWSAFIPVLAHLKEEKARGKLRGVILTSAKKTFMAGGDLEYLFQATDAKEIFSAAEGLKKFLRDLESPGVPVVAAINGDAIAVIIADSMPSQRDLKLHWAVITGLCWMIPISGSGFRR